MSDLKKISVILGTRPEAIKLAPVILALRKEPDIDCRVCVTAQHRQMLDDNLGVFGITPDIDMDLMRPGQSLNELASSAIKAIGAYLSDQLPDLVIVQGDTTTVLAAALAAFHHGVPVAHLEAGLRSGNMRAPWPEEMNRVLTSRLSTLHFAPTELAGNNLLKEGVPETSISITGNTVVDALLIAVDRVRAEPPPVPGLAEEVLSLPGAERMVLITGHRRESFGPGFEQICAAVRTLAGNFRDVHFVYPVHLNPHVRKPVFEILSGSPNIHLLDPLPYLSFVRLLDAATLVLTDSGGIQEEAPSLGKPVLVMRDVTERREGIEAGTAKLVGTDSARIVSEVSHLLSDRAAYDRTSRVHNPYGDGHAAERVVRHCREFLASNQTSGI